MFRDSFKMFEEDPFFSEFSPHFQPLMPSEPSGPRSRDKGSNRNNEIQASDPFQSMFRSMNSIMSDMHSQFKNLEQSNANGHSFSHSSVMTYSNDGKSKPKIMQASSSMRRAPGQIKETRKTYRDSEAGIEKMAIGHHIGQRGHEMEKRRRNRGAIEEEKRFFEITEDDYPSFEQEWKEKTSAFGLPPQRYRELGSSKQREAGRRNSPALRPDGPSPHGRKPRALH